MNHRRHPVLALLLLAGSFGAHAADTPSGEEFSTTYPDPTSGYEAPGTYSNDPYAQPRQQQAPGGWSGQSSAPANGGYGASGNAYGGGYGGGQAAGGIQGGSFKGRGQTQGGGTSNPYSSGKTFTKPPKNAIDPSAFGGSGGGGGGYETPAPSPY